MSAMRWVDRLVPGRSRHRRFTTSLAQYVFYRTYMDIHERLRQSVQSRRLAWQVLQEIRQVLEILGDQRIPYEGEMKRFRAEGDFLVRALTDLVSQCRSQIHQLEHEFEELEKLARERELPRDILQAVHHMSRQRNGLGLTGTQLRERLNQLQELHILPEHRVQPDLNSDAC
jgi:hypothetical protein